MGWRGGRQARKERKVMGFSKKIKKPALPSIKTPKLMGFDCASGADIPSPKPNRQTQTDSFLEGIGLKDHS